MNFDFLRIFSKSQEVLKNSHGLLKFNKLSFNTSIIQVCY